MLYRRGATSSVRPSWSIPHSRAVSITRRDLRLSISASASAASGPRLLPLTSREVSAGCAASGASNAAKQPSGSPTRAKHSERRRQCAAAAPPSAVVTCTARSAGGDSGSSSGRLEASGWPDRSRWVSERLVRSMRATATPQAHRALRPMLETPRSAASRLHSRVVRLSDRPTASAKAPRASAGEKKSGLSDRRRVSASATPADAPRPFALTSSSCSGLRTGTPRAETNTSTPPSSPSAHRGNRSLSRRPEESSGFMARASAALASAVDPAGSAGSRSADEAPKSAGPGAAAGGGTAAAWAVPVMSRQRRRVLASAAKRASASGLASHALARPRHAAPACADGHSGATPTDVTPRAAAITSRKWGEERRAAGRSRRVVTASAACSESAAICATATCGALKRAKERAPPPSGTARRWLAASGVLETKAARSSAASRAGRPCSSHLSASSHSRTWPRGTWCLPMTGGGGGTEDGREPITGGAARCARSRVASSSARSTACSSTGGDGPRESTWRKSPSRRSSGRPVRAETTPPAARASAMAAASAAFRPAEATPSGAGCGAGTSTADGGAV
eukprot:scaffold7401_cov108-Isochrysis_galbana.AAC.3